MNPRQQIQSRYDALGISLLQTIEQAEAISLSGHACKKFEPYMQRPWRGLCLRMEMVPLNALRDATPGSCCPC